jgi:Putative secretion activating protein
MDVEKLIDEVIAREGGYTNHPADRGGPTNFGITEQVAKAFGYKGDMKDLPRATAVAIYRERYWTGPKFDQVAAIFPQVGHELFDTGVNMGPSTAAKFLQRVLNALNRGATDYPDIGVDGGIGKLTLAAAAGLKAKRGAAVGEVVRQAIDALQGARYIDIVEANPSQEVFAYGWLSQRLGLFQ